MIDPRERVLLFDVESRSRADLKKIGGRRYWEHPSTETIVAVWYDTNPGPGAESWGVWIPGDPPPPAIAEGVRVAAHNYSGFDRFACWRMGWFEPDSEHDLGGVDTAECARVAGLPGALDALAKQWLGREKDKAASRYTLSLSHPSRAKARLGQLPEITAKAFERVLAYCVSDVEILVHGWPFLAEWWPEVADLEHVLQADRAVNDRGVCFDRDLARALLVHDARLGEAAVLEAAAELGWTPAEVRTRTMSPVQFAPLAYSGDATAETVRDILEHPERYSPAAPAMARTRQALASIARGKLRAGLARVSDDGRIRDAHRYYGGHTGRWSQRGMQLHNIPRPSKDFAELGGEEIAAHAVAALDPSAPVTSDEITSILLRACIHAPPGYTLAVCDFKGIEARMLAWMAGDQFALDVFESGRDPYTTEAASIFQKPYEQVDKIERGVGKVAVLALGYQGAQGALANMAGQYGIDFDAIGVNPARVVTAWRAAHAPVVRLWKEFEAACVQVLRRGPGAECSIAGGLFTAVCGDDGTAFAIRDPSGALMCYRDASLVPGKFKPQIRFRGPRGFEHTYGGKLVENATQRMARHLMALALVRAELRNLRPVLGVHDEIVSEIAITPEAYESAGPFPYAYDPSGATGSRALQEAMLELPAWAHGFPVGVSGHTGTRYRK